ncbi:hypothetical protein KEM54_002868, partial [Ascosphaera aggregata]
MPIEPDDPAILASINGSKPNIPYPSFSKTHSKEIVRPISGILTPDSTVDYRDLKENNNHISPHFSPTDTTSIRHRDRDATAPNGTSTRDQVPLPTRKPPPPPPNTGNTAAAPPPSPPLTNLEDNLPTKRPTTTTTSPATSLHRYDRNDRNDRTRPSPTTPKFERGAENASIYSSRDRPSGARPKPPSSKSTSSSGLQRGSLEDERTRIAAAGAGAAAAKASKSSTPMKDRIKETFHL